MSDQLTVKNGFGTWPFVLPNVAETLQVQTRALLEKQTELFAETQKIIAAWTRRRQEAMETGFQTLQTMFVCKDIGAMSTAYGEWLMGSMNRIFADISDAQQEALRLAEIGQKSLTTVFRHSTDMAAPPASTVPSAGAGKEARRMKGALPTEASDRAAVE